MWFTVTIYLRSSEPVDGSVLVEEAVHLIEAASDDEARSKALLVAKRLEHRYANVAGKDVVWSVESVGEPYELMDGLKDGAEVYSRFISR
jgi:hypothetical protein